MKRPLSRHLQILPFSKDEAGVTAIEYTILVFLVGSAILVSVTLMGRNLSSKFGILSGTVNPTTVAGEVASLGINPNTIYRVATFSMTGCSTGPGTYGTCTFGAGQIIKDVVAQMSAAGTIPASITTEAQSVIAAGGFGTFGQTVQSMAQNLEIQALSSQLASQMKWNSGGGMTAENWTMTGSNLTTFLNQDVPSASSSGANQLKTDIASSVVTTPPASGGIVAGQY